MAPPRLHSRQIIARPITPLKGGLAPNFVVACITDGCTFAVDVHALTAENAVLAVAPGHAPSHLLIAREVDYSTHPLYGGAHAHAQVPPVQQEQPAAES